MIQAVKDTEFVVFDFETTGILPGEHSVCELAAVRIRGATISETFSTLVNPGRSIPDEATRVHGISDQDVVSAPFFGEIWENFRGFLGNAVLLGYNIGFDLGFLREELRRTGTDFPVNHAVDVIAMARTYLPGLTRYNLQHVSNQLHMVTPQFHRALFDARVTGEIFLHFLPFLEKSGIVSLEELLSVFGVSQRSKLEQEKISLFDQAIQRQKTVHIKYLASNGGFLSERDIVPKKIEIRQEKTYLVAFCLRNNEERTFRISHILETAIVEKDQFL